MDGNGCGFQLSLADGRELVLYKNCVDLPKPQVRSECKPPLRWFSLRKSQENGELHNFIPLQLILWAECQGKTVSITFAEYTSPTELRPTTRTYTPALSSRSEIDTWVAALIRRAYGTAQRQKRALVLINPHAGPGKAWKKWTKVLPLFEAARMEIEVMVTSQPGEAIAIARNLHIDRFDTVIACSGDGLPHEIFNGFAQRPDARRALSKVAVSQRPCGSGNAMACNLYGSHHASLAALGIIKGIDTAIDLVSYTQGDRRGVSFLSQALGIIAEADLGTEHMRWMGAARFHVGVLTRILRKKAYPCDIDVKVELEDKADIQLAFRAAAAIPGLEDPIDTWEADAETQGLPPLKYGTVQDPLPSDGWRRIKYYNMGSFYCGKMAFIAPHVAFFPASLPNDGLLDLVTFSSDIPIIKAFELFRKAGKNAAHFHHPDVKYYKISALRISPRDQDGCISIDGERLPFAPSQVEVHPGLDKVYSLSGKYSEGGLGRELTCVGISGL